MERPKPQAHDMDDNASLDSTGKRKSFRRIMERFADKTSVIGVLYISNAKLKKAKAIWVFLLLAAIAALIYHLYYLCSQFFVWPKTTTISLGFDNLNMPAVTICNVNTVKVTQLQNMTDAYQRLVMSLQPKPLGPNGRRRRFVEEFDQLNITEYDQNAPPDNKPNRPPRNTIAGIEETAKNLFMDHPRSTRVNAGHSLRDMLVSCSFDGRDCYPNNFTLYPTAEFGNCYTLQSSDFTVQSSGPTHGLTMVLYTESSQYQKGLTQGYGARVTIHPPGSFPFPNIDGIYTSSGFETSISLKMVNISRIGRPWGTCEEGETFSSTYKKTYTREACRAVCENDKVIEECNCFNKDYAEVYRVASKDYRPCQSKAERECLEEQQEVIKSKQFKCSCLDPCSEKVYEKTTSSRQWPTEDYSTLLLDSICEDKDKSRECAWLSNMDKRQLSLNFLKIVVYFESLNFENVEEQEEITVAQFLSDFGGALGLWIGLSVISLFELVQLATELCDYGCQRSRKKEEEQRRRQQSYLRNQYTDLHPPLDNHHHDNHYGRHGYPDPAMDPRYVSKDYGGQYELYTGHPSRLSNGYPSSNPPSYR